MPEQEQFLDFKFPVLGIDLFRAFGVQRPGTTVLGVNVRTFEPETMRGRGGSRPGLMRQAPGQLPTADVIQNLSVVVSVDGTALLANYNDQPPDLYDPSDEGPLDAWPTGRFRRVPAPGLPEGGWAVPPWRLAPESVAITWGDLSPIGLGTGLSSTQLNAVATDRTTGDAVAGTYHYDPVSGTQLPLGEGQTLRLRFVPDDTDRYGTTYALNEIDVIQAGDELIQYVQSAEGSEETDGPPWEVTIELPFDTEVTEGNLLLAFVGVLGRNALAPSLSATACSSTLNGSWTKLTEITTTISGTIPHLGLSIWYRIAQTSGAETVTAQIGEESAYQQLYRYMVIMEYTNVNTAALQQFQGSSTNSSGGLLDTPLSTGNIDINAINQMLLGAFIHTPNSVTTPGADFTQREETGSTVLLEVMEYNVVFPLEATPVTMTSPAGVRWAGVGCSVKPV